MFPSNDASPELTPAELYLDLLKKCLTRSIFGEKYRSLPANNGSVLVRTVGKWLAARDLQIVRSVKFDPHARAEGLDWPADGETMIGLKRLQNLQDCITDVVQQNIPGDLIETGVWRGGAAIFMRAVLKVLGDKERTVWLADSFAGLPPPSPDRYPADKGAGFHLANDVLGVSVEEVKGNFERYGMLDDRVRFLKGWFKDTLPSAPIEKLSILRLDGDLYESTMTALEALYPKLSLGGYAIIDDYAPAVPCCVQAVEDFRRAHNITEKMESTGEYGVYWRRLR
ncbi:MAG TPA: TylF/MycF family methyltransferase [Pyrinomonadaceae bacterium]|nr:TylF/MycF family methyltransferase [Pyrinomonadaceae bacterium]